MALGDGRDRQDGLRVTKAWETQNNIMTLEGCHVLGATEGNLGVSPSSQRHYSFSGDCPLHTPASLCTVTGAPQTAGRAGPPVGAGKQGKGVRCAGRTRSANASPGSPLLSQPPVSRGAVQGARTLDSPVISPGRSVLARSMEVNCAPFSRSL